MEIVIHKKVIYSQCDNDILSKSLGQVEDRGEAEKMAQRYVRKKVSHGYNRIFEESFSGYQIEKRLADKTIHITAIIKQV